MAAEATDAPGRFEGLPFPALRFAPPDARRGGLVVINGGQDCDEALLEVALAFAQDGFECLVPSLIAHRASDAGMDQAKARNALAGDLQTAIEALAPPVFALGYGWGGSAAWVAACRCEGLAAASSYCGDAIAELIEETPRCPVILHFARRSGGAPASAIAAIAAAHPEIPIHLYDAAPGFACGPQAPAWPDAARLARLRTLQLFARAGGRGEAG